MPIEHPPLNEQENYPDDLLEELDSVDYKHVDSGIYDFRQNTLERKDSCVDWIQFETKSYTVRILSQFKKPRKPSEGDNIDTRIAFFWKLKDPILRARIKLDKKRKEELWISYNKLIQTIKDNLSSKKDLELQRKSIEKAERYLARIPKIHDEIDKLESEINKHEQDREFKSKWFEEEDADRFPNELCEWLNKFCYRNFTYLDIRIYSIDG